MNKNCLHNCLYNIGWVRMEMSFEKIRKKCNYLVLDIKITEYVNGGEDIYERLRRIYRSIVFLRRVIGRGGVLKWDKYLKMIRNNLQIQYEQILREQNLKYRRERIAFVMTGWVSFHEEIDEWVYTTYRNYLFWNTYYRKHNKKWKGTDNPQEYKIVIHEFLQRIYRLRVENYKREEMMARVLENNKARKSEKFRIMYQET